MADKQLIASKNGRKRKVFKSGTGRDFSKSVRAGKRTYFFDVKATRKNEYYLTVTESKKRFEEDGRFHFEKHKMFLYREDFDKFIEGLTEAVAFIKSQPESDIHYDYDRER